MSKPPVHLIGNAHLDPAWLWPWAEGMSEARATFASALERMDEYPGFVFTASAAAVYEWVERTAPELFEKIRARVAEGRWCVVGGWRAQSDCNLPGGESFARNALYSQRWFRRKFGRTCRTGYCVDSFGHAGSLPQLLAQGGMDAYVFMRPMKKENPAMPEGPFVWEGTDGTRVQCFRIFGNYGAGSPWAVDQELKAIDAVKPPLAMLFYGVGDHGGGPTKEVLNHIEKLKAEGQSLVYSSPDRFFEELAPHRESLPVWKGELQIHAVGCYTAESRIKRANRRAEWRLLAAERLAAAAQLAVGAPAPAERLEAAWKDVLFLQFHDVMAGSCERVVCDESLQQFARAEFTAAEIVAESVQRIGGAVDTRGEGRTLLVFNPHAFPVSALVETDDTFVHPVVQHVRTLRVEDGAGAVAAHQSVPISSRASVMRLVFPVELPALGWRLFRLVMDDRRPDEKVEWTLAVPETAAKLPGRLAANADGIENEHLRLAVGGDGCIQLRDLAAGWDVLRGGGGLALVLDDASDTWSHDVTRYDREAGAFKLESRELIESGPLRARLRLGFAFGLSRLTLDYVLERNARAVRVEAMLDWRERQRMLKFVFPVAVDAPVWTSEIPYGEIIRPLNGNELPMQSWTDLSDGSRGLSVVNDGKYGLDARDGALRITILRSPPFAHHDPLKLDGRERIMDQGLQEFRLLLVPHGPKWRAEVARAAAVLNCPPVISWEGTHGGRLPGDSGPAVSVAGDGVTVMAMKRAEDGGAWVLRAFESAARSEEASFEIQALKRKWSAKFRAGEVKTFLVPDDAAEPVREANFLEERTS